MFICSICNYHLKSRQYSCVTTCRRTRWREGTCSKCLHNLWRHWSLQLLCRRYLQRENDMQLCTLWVPPPKQVKHDFGLIASGEAKVQLIAKCEPSQNRHLLLHVILRRNLHGNSGWVAIEEIIYLYINVRWFLAIDVLWCLQERVRNIHCVFRFQVCLVMIWRGCLVRNISIIEMWIAF